MDIALDESTGSMAHGENEESECRTTEPQSRWLAIESARFQE
jgi:hypothetical protein